MPIYEFRCKKCQHIYEELMTIKNYGNKNHMKKVKCPECNSSSKEHVMSNVNFNFTNPVGSDRYTNSHDYRYNYAYNMKGGLRDQRAAQEANSHMGAKPYNEINDLHLDEGIHDAEERKGLS